MDTQKVQAAPSQSEPAPDAGGPPRAPMAVLMERLEQAAPFVSVKDPALKDRIGWLADEAAAAPAALDKPWFRTRVGYVVQDVERLNNTQLVMDPALRAELDKLALSSPGLRHEQLAGLVRETAHLRPEDGPLAQDIRRLARSAVTGSVDVTSDEGRKQVEQLTERVQAAKTGDPAPVSSVSAPSTADPATAASTAAGPNPLSAAASAEAAPTASATPGQTAVPAAAGSQPASPVPAQSAASNGRPAPAASVPAAATPATGAPAQTTVNAQQVQFRGTLRDILASARPPEPATPPPWSNEHAPLTGRLGSYEQRHADENSSLLVTKAQEAAHNAVRAVEALGNGPGSGVLNKIKQAAAGDPDGLPGVMAGMQPGGKYAQLRAEFNATMTAERAFAASYDKVAQTAGQYATARQAAGADFARRGADLTQLDGQFAELDKAIGEGTAAVPGRDGGKSMQQELAEKAAEFFRQLMERVKTSFSPEQKPGVTPTPAPRPGLSM